MERIKVSLVEGYTRWAEGYDAYPNPLLIAEEPIVRGLLDDVSGKRVVDVAAGTGRYALWLARRGAQVTAVEPTAAMRAVGEAKEAKEAKEGRSSITWVDASADALPMPDGAFDVVVNALLLEHLPDAHVAAALREAQRVLAPGGALVLSAYHPMFALKGVPAHFVSGDVEYELPTHVHLPSTYLRILLDLEMRLTHIFEPVVDDALIAARPNMEKHRGLPIALVLRAIKEGPTDPLARTTLTGGSGS